MNRTRTFLITAATSILALGFICGCSPTIGAWTDRGEIGCDNEQTNADAWRDLAVSMLDAAKRINIEAVFIDLKAVNAGKVEGADGKPIPLDNGYIDAKHTILSALLDGFGNRQAAIDEMHERHTANIEATRESFARIRQLNVAWAGANGQMAAQIERLIDELRRQRQETGK